MILIIAIATGVIRAGLPRGLRNNNPGNIRSTGIQWQGMAAIQFDPEFVVFKHPKYGFRAMVRILRSYQQRGLNSVQKIIETYAPKSENETESYVQFVSKQLGVNPNQPIDTERQLFPLLKAISTFENGFAFINFYADNTINEGIALA